MNVSVESATYSAALKLATRLAGRANAQQEEDAFDAYREWATRLNYLWRPEHYANPAFPKIYLEKLYFRRLSEHKCAFEQMTDGPEKKAFRRLITKFLLHRPRGQDGTIRIKVMSFGCGPAPDAVAVIHFLHCYATKELDIPSEQLKFHVTLVDRVWGWKRIAEAAVQALDQAEVDIRVNFLNGDSRYQSPEVLEAAEACDWISISHVLLDTIKLKRRAAAERFLDQVINAWTHQACKVNGRTKILHLADRLPLEQVLPDNFEDYGTIICHPLAGRPNSFVSVTKVPMRGRAEAPAGDNTVVERMQALSLAR